MPSARILSSLHEVPPATWDALAGAHNPFVEHAFLSTLEDSGSVGKGSAWIPQHLTVWEGERLLSAAPAYLRGDSYGEYIFDWGWAEAAHCAGIRYYPKISLAIPFTPATGPRLMGEGSLLLPLLSRLATEQKVSGSHILFLTEEEEALATAAGWLPRASLQFHWRSRGWADFDAFLADLTRKRRHEIQRERRKVREAGVQVRVLTGAEMEPEDWAILRECYRSTIAKMGAIPYLKDRFFALLPERLSHRVVAAIATHNGRRIAATLNYWKGEHLYGRYWGCLEEVPGLHFECCYYSLLEWGIPRGITLFEAGAQGEHKLSRGFLPTLTRSVHQLRNPGLHNAVGQFLAEERRRVTSGIAAYMEESPFKEPV
jgi:uncharacterized protein